MLKWPFNLFLKSNDIKIIYVAVLIVISAQIGFFLSFESSNVLPLWPPVGVVFALVLLLGHRIWPGIVIGGFITYSISFINQDILISVSSITSILVITIGVVLEVLTGYVLYKKFLSEGNPYDNTANAFKFLLICLSVCLIGAGSYTGSLYSIGAITSEGVLIDFINNYLGSITGMFLFTNFILAWVKGKTHWKLSLRNVFEAVVFSCFIILILYLLSSNTLSLSFERSFPFLIIPFLLWVAFRVNIQMTITYTVLISLYSIYITKTGSGPFLLETDQESMFLLQIFIGVITISAIILSSAVFERTESARKIADFNEKLEAAVTKRTSELDKEIKIRKKTEEDMRKKNKELRKINTELDNFVYKASHDLRSPISSILGLINLTKYDKSEENIESCLDQIEKSANLQDNFIREIIELSKNSRVELIKEEVDFEEMLKEINLQMKDMYNGNTVKPKLKLSQNKPFISDPNRIKIIFNNLISNSIKFKSETKPSITIDIKVENGHANINIDDNGKGIEPEHIDKVFDMFYRATDKNAGSGLGLYIVRETVGKLEGEVLITSEPEKGTSVNLVLPNYD